MFFNQSRPERSESFQYRKSNRSGTSAQPRNLSGGIGKGGGGPAPPPSSTSTNSSLSSNRSFKKSNNVQGGQSRVSSVGVNPDPNYASAARTTQNGAHSQPSVHGAADAPLAWVPVKPTTDMPTQKITQAVPKAPSSLPAIVNSDSTPPATPAKGEASKSFPLQSGSISPGFVNGIQIPAQTNSAPPNLDEQQRDQVRHDSQRTVQPFPIPSVPKKQLPRKDGDAGDQSHTGEAHQMSKPKRDVQFSSASPVTQTQKTSVHHIPGVSMPMPFHQPQVPVQLGGPKPPIQLQGMAATSLPVPMPMHMSMPLPMGNAQLQQSVFVPNLQPHPMQPQGIMHQGQSLNFSPQMGPHMPSQLGNLGISIGPPFAQHQAGKYSVQRKPVKITHPDTHEELRLGGSSGNRSHPNVPQSQPIPSIPPGHSINYYSNSYSPNTLFFPAPSSVPLTSTQINPSSQAPRFSYPPSRSTQTPTFVNSSAHNSHSSKISASDLYMAYKGPEEKNEIVASLNSITSTSGVISKHELVDTTQDDIDVSKGKKKGKKKRKEILQKADAYDIDVSKGKKKGKKKIKEILQKADAFIVLKKAGQHKSEPVDWEDAADVSTPRLEAVDDGKQVHNEDGNGLTKKYSRDFLLKFSEQCSELPEGLEITSAIAEALMSSNLNASRELHPSPARIVDRPSLVSRLDCRGSGLGGDDRWNKLPGPLVSGQEPRMDGYGSNLRPDQVGNYGVLWNPRAQTPPQYVGGILSGPLQSLGSQVGVQPNTPDSDRWQRASSFQKGLIPSPQTPLQVMHKAAKKYEVGKTTDEEVAKQRRLKAILNKLTPQNFEKLFEQVKEVNIDNTVTLTGVISQIFDKALMEPTFCEMYANFCYYLAGEWPDFSEDNEKITFKRLLLNKFQEVFERDAREQEEADRADDEGDVKLSEGEREEKRIQARRRTLGNIRLIGELYKKKMLTEKIMHECIKKLLGEYQNPDEEDIEALCKLMSTIGEMIDHPKAKPFMDAYFDRMAKLSNNMNLSSRLRFMLKDSIDLRENNKWQQRRKLFEQVKEVNNDTFTTFGSNPAPTADVAVGPNLGLTHLTQRKKKKNKRTEFF